MSDLELEIDIINNEKKEVSSKRKTALFSILGGLWLLLLYSQPLKENSIYDTMGIWKGYPLILFFVLLISTGFVITYVFFMVPSKGKLNISPDGIMISLNKEKYSLRLQEIKTIEFVFFQIEIEDVSLQLNLISEKISLSNELDLVFFYDPMGNRIAKLEEVETSPELEDCDITWYSRDAQGNVMATYLTDGTNSDYYLTDFSIYGSSRLGVKKVDEKLGDIVFNSYFSPELGTKMYEFSNHLGNVLATVSDIKLSSDANSDGFIDSYSADITSSQDYYPFGMIMPDRFGSSGNYRFGFNGKENDNEVKGTGNSVDFGGRIYDSRLGRWLSVDPLQNKYPDLSPYQFCSNMPISAKDPDGRVIIFINGMWGPPTRCQGKGGDVSYWGDTWVKRTQDAIGDHKAPRYYDGSLGGAAGLFEYYTSFYAENRRDAGKETGYNDAKSIIDNLGTGETIKIVTNSMGAAFERGFTDGLFQYVNERLNVISPELTFLNSQKAKLEKTLIKVGLQAYSFWRIQQLMN